MPKPSRPFYFSLRWVVLSVLTIALLVGAVTPFGRRFASAVFGPTVSLCGAFFRVVGDGIRWIQPGALSRRDALLESERLVQELQARLDSQEDLRKENQELRRLASLPARQEWRAVLAEVISRDPARWYDCLLVNRGAKDGLVTGALVLVDGYAFGRVIRCYAHTAEVVSVLSRECRFGVGLSGGDVAGVLQGCGKEHPFADGTLGFQVEYLPKELTVTSEQLVVTSGLGGMMPPGIPVGRILPDAPDGGRVHHPDMARSMLHCAPLAPMGTIHFVCIMAPIN